MGLSLRRTHPIHFVSLSTGAHAFMAWFRLTVWRWEFDLSWYRGMP